MIGGRLKTFSDGLKSKLQQQVACRKRRLPMDLSNQAKSGSNR